MIKSQSMQDLRKKAGDALDQRVRAIMAGVGLTELRALMRGDPPTEKPNPRYKVHTTSFLFHIRPRYYEAGSTILTHTFRLGFLTSLFFFIEVITGLILMIYYTPSPEKAYTSMVNLLAGVPFGQFLRDMHRLGAEAMVIFTFLHMLRTFFTASYKKERSFTWLTGLVLLLITLVLSFSGYLLPWDQLAYWAVTIGTSMVEAAPLVGSQLNLLVRGAQDIGADGLLRFYLMHVVLLPLAAILVISIHYYKVSREHGISLPAKFEEGNVSPEAKKAAKTRLDFLPDLFTREIFWVGLGLLLVILTITVFGWHAALENPANPQLTPLDTEAPWYFLWLQGLLKLGDKTLMGIIIPTILAILLVLLPYIDRNPARSVYKRPVAVGIGVLGVAALIVLTYMGSPEYGIPTDPAARIVQDIAPMEGVGPLREVPFEQLQPGTYIVNETEAFNMCPDLPYGCPDLEQVFIEYSDAVNEASASGDLPNAQAAMVIEAWQPGTLKKTTFRINWEEEGQPFIYSKDIFIHVYRNPASER
ncbi:MAG: petB [Chloroflexi bacterium]|jgi:quinol-cytochrome oxidoreductase complex cytochrome b subunit|nr:petB [Chloroflexota bacterium]